LVTNSDRLDELCPEHGYEFRTDDFLKLSGPIVYLFLDANDKPLYIGVSRNGVRRAADPDHHMAHVRQDSTSVLIYPCESIEKAGALERYLIGTLMPEYNEKYNPLRCKDLGAKRIMDALHLNIH
jgi:hypothetical protein